MTLGTTSPAARAPFQPVLKSTLPGSWDENWFASPAVHDLDGDGQAEIIAARASVLSVWNAQGALAWRAVAGSPGVQTEVHGTDRQYAGPVVGDLDGGGKGEIAIAYANKAAVYDAQGRLFPGWPQTFPGPSAEIRSIAAADLDGDGKPFAAHATFAAAGPWASSVPMFHDLALALKGYGPQGQDRDEFTYSPPVFADLDGDGQREILLHSHHERAGAGEFPSVGDGGGGEGAGGDWDGEACGAGGESAGEVETRVAGYPGTSHPGRESGILKFQVSDALATSPAFGLPIDQAPPERRGLRRSDCRDDPIQAGPFRRRAGPQALA